MAISIEFVAELRELIRGIERGEVSLDELREYVDQVGEAGEDAGRQAERGMDQISDSARSARDDLEDTGDAATDVGGKLGDLGGAARDVLEGDFAGGAETALGSLTGLAAAIPGIGGLIGGALGGIAVGMLNAWNENAEKSEARIAAMYDDFLESGSRYLSQSYLQTALEELVKNEEELNRAREIAKATGLDLAAVMNGMVGSASDRAALERTIKQTIEEQKALSEEAWAANGGEHLGSLKDLSEEHGVIAGYLEKELGYLQEQNTERADAYEAAQLVLDAVSKLPEEEKRATDAATARLQAYADAAAKGVDIPVRVETPDVDAVLSGIQGRINRRPLTVRVRPQDDSGRLY